MFQQRKSPAQLRARTAVTKGLSLGPSTPSPVPQLPAGEVLPLSFLPQEVQGGDKLKAGSGHWECQQGASGAAPWSSKLPRSQLWPVKPLLCPAPGKTTVLPDKGREKEIFTCEGQQQQSSAPSAAFAVQVWDEILLPAGQGDREGLWGLLPWAGLGWAGILSTSREKHGIPGLGHARHRAGMWARSLGHSQLIPRC